MSVHQCPKCELKFALLTVLEDHCRHDHPKFHHDYPVRGEHHWDAATTGASADEPAGSTAR
jgi:hypothetical protein